MLSWNKRRKQLLQEFETHIEFEVRDNIEAGMSPSEARQAARKKFGSPLLAAEESRAMWGGLWLESLLQDFRYAVRWLGGSPAYTATLVCTLVLGLGAVTTMLAITDSILMQPVALPHPDQLVYINSEEGPTGTSASPHALSYKVLDELERSNRSFVGVSGYNTMARPVSALDGTRITPLTEVTSHFFPMLGIQARLGRSIRPGDEQSAVVVVSDEFWRERLHGESGAIGSTIKVSGQLRTVIGVMPAGFHAPHGTGAPMVYLPISVKAKGEDAFLFESALVIARLRPGVSRQQALTDAQSILARVEQRSAERDRRLALHSYQDFVVGDLKEPLLGILGGVLLLLLIACANAANLQIGRAASRRFEMTTRSALGATFGRLLQQLIIESIVVSLLGGLLGSLLSYVAIALIRHTYGGEFSRFDELSVHPIVMAFTGVLAVVVGVVTSVSPMLSIRRQTTAQFNSKNVSRESRLPSVLVAIQIAFTCVLLVVSGLFVRTLQSLQNVHLGFDPHNVTTLVLMPERENQDPELSREIESRLLRRFETIPGIQSVTMQTAVPFSSYNMTLNGTTEVAGRAFHQGDSAFYSMVSTNFVRTSGIKLLKGRGFTPNDEASAAVNVLVNEAFQNKYLRGRESTGASLRFHRNPGETDADLPFVQSMTIVGVLENEVQGGDLGAPYQPMVYLDNLRLPKGSPLAQVFSMAAQYAIRSPLPPAVLASELRVVVKKEAPTMVEMNLQSMESAIAKSLGQRRLALRLVAGFGIVALALSAVGIYGVLAYSVTLRRREIGIRMALGSTRRRAAGLVISQAGAMALLGLVPGIAGAWAAGRAVDSFLYGVRNFDMATAAGAGLLLLLVFAASASLPVMRAATIDPAETLRAE